MLVYLRLYLSQSIMNIRFLYTLFIAFFLPFTTFAQNIEGQVISEEEALIGANVFWLNTDVGTTTDIEGFFSLATHASADQLVVSYVGYQNDTIRVQDFNTPLKITLQSTAALETVVVTEDRQGTFVSSIDPIKTEVITQKELSRSACCDLAGCFNTQASVQPTTTNIITNAKELRILGLSGVYNQILIDGFPLIQGLSYTYGISSVPGTLVDNIYVAKGANSVLQGYESISGQINVILKEPHKTDKLYLNVYANSFGESQYNANYSQKWDKWSTLIAAHSTQPANKQDRDDDNFLDLPQTTRYSLANKWQYRDANEWGWHAKIGLRYIDEQRIGGQTFFDADKDKGTTNAYGQVVDFGQAEVYSKFGYRMDDYNHFVAYISAFRQEQDSYYGTTHYQAEQNSLYSNLQYERNWQEQHSFKTGVSFRYFNLDENIDFGQDSLGRTYAGDYLRDEQILGLFAENTFNFYDNKLTLITGFRADHHNDFGWQATPRALLKANVSDNITARISAGTGWRTVNVFSENINILASSRDLILEETLKPEKALNYGANITHKYYSKQFETQLTLDFYRTTFSNQIFPDYDSDPTQAIVRNFEGTSISNGFQAELGIALFKRVGTKFAYNYLDVYRDIDGKKEALPFNAKHRMTATFSYEPLSKGWHWDTNIHWMGEQRLANSLDAESATYSDTYTVVNTQFAKVFKQLEIYVGCENIFDFRQERPIRAWETPFSPYFDTANVWGPTKGREFHAGVKFKIE